MNVLFFPSNHQLRLLFTLILHFHALLSNIKFSNHFFIAVHHQIVRI